MTCSKTAVSGGVKYNGTNSTDIAILLYRAYKS